MKFLFFALALCAAAPKEKLTCNAKELAGQDCHLGSGNYDIRLLPKTIAWNDGTWHTVDEMPLKGEASAWEKVEFKFVSGWPILQLWLWDKGAGESAVQSLHWYTADAEHRRFTIISEGVVRKRRLEKVEEGAKPRYLFDPMENHSLKANKKGGLEWQLGTQKKIISKRLPQ